MSGSSSYVDTDAIVTYVITSKIFSYCAVCPGILSEQTLIPFESVVESIIININKLDKRKNKSGT